MKGCGVLNRLLRIVISSVVLIMMLTYVSFPFIIAVHAYTPVVPSYNVPSYEIPDYEVPDYEVPDYNAPNYNVPNYEVPSYGGNSSTDINQNSGNSINPNDQNLTDTANYSNEPNQNKGNYGNEISNDPFINFTKPSLYDALKFSFDDVLGGTVLFVEEAIRNNSEVTLKDYNKHRNDLIWTGFTIFTDDPTIEAIDNIYSAIDDTIDISEETKKILDIGKAGDIIDALDNVEDISHISKTFTPANAVVSAALLPFTIYDAANNYKEFKDAKTSEEKTNAGFDLAGNAGDFLTGLAPAAAFVPLPGARAVAVGMLVIGGTLSLVSLGHKLWRNRKKIAEDVGKKFNQAKDAVKGFFNSIFGK